MAIGTWGLSGFSITEQAIAHEIMTASGRGYEGSIHDLMYTGEELWIPRVGGCVRCTGWSQGDQTVLDLPLASHELAEGKKRRDFLSGKSHSFLVLWSIVLSGYELDDPRQGFAGHPGGCKQNWFSFVRLVTQHDKYLVTAANTAYTWDSWVYYKAGVRHDMLHWIDNAGSSSHSHWRG